MNNTFNIHRFNLLLKRQWLEFGKVYLMTLGIVLAIIICFYGISFSNIDEYKKSSIVNNLLRFRIPLFVLLGLLFISITASAYFSHLGNKARAIGDLLTPASKLEKYSTAIIYSTIVPILSYLIIFYVVDFAFIQTSLNNHTETQNVYENGGYVDRTMRNVDWLFFKFLLLSNRDFWYLVSICTGFSLLVTSVFLSGSIYFSRFQYIKTLVTVAALISILTLTYMQASQFFFTNKIRVTSNQNYGNKDGDLLIIVAAIALVALFFYVVGYIRYKEKEV